MNQDSMPGPELHKKVAEPAVDATTTAWRQRKAELARDIPEPDVQDVEFVVRQCTQN